MRPSLVRDALGAERRERVPRQGPAGRLLEVERRPRPKGGPLRACLGLGPETFAEKRRRARGRAAGGKAEAE